MHMTSFIGLSKNSTALYTYSHSQVVLNDWKLFETGCFKSKEPYILDGKSLTLPDVIAIARYGRKIAVDERKLARGTKSVDDLHDRVKEKRVIYGVNTGFGGSADTRTNSVRKIQYALIRELHCCILPSPLSGSASVSPPIGDGGDIKALMEQALPLEDPVASNHMPEAWSRAMLLIRLNSLLGGQSAVRPEILSGFVALLNQNITPVIPLRGTVSASGDLAPLAYVAGAILGKRTSYVWVGNPGDRRRVRADIALKEAGLPSLTLEKKEGLAIVNGTGASCAVGALATYDANHLAVMAQILTAMSTEALNGTDESFQPYIAEVRPHKGQIDSAHNIFSFLRDSKLLHKESDVSAFGKLRQDRYSIRSASQWLGPSLEDLLLSHKQVLTECNSITDNPIIHPSGRVYTSANFQAKVITSAMEKMRQSIESIGRILFAQTTEMVNPATNKGLPPNLVSCEPSESWLFKMVDIMLAALQGELGFLAHPVNHVHTTETGNQSVHSLALISARYTHTALGILSQIIASHLLMVCQALDLRAMQANFLVALEPLFNDLLQARLGALFMSTKNEGPDDDLKVATLHKQLWSALPDLLDKTTNMDCDHRFAFVAASLQPLILAHSFKKEISGSAASFTQHLSAWEIDCGRLMKEQFLKNRSEYSVNADATPYLGRASKKMYRFIRQDLEIPFLRTEDLAEPEDLVEAEDLGQFKGSMNEGPLPASTAQYITKIYEALRNGVLYAPAMECLQEALVKS